jgi:hypothetical protein
VQGDAITTNREALGIRRGVKLDHIAGLGTVEDRLDALARRDGMRGRSGEHGA